MRAGLAMIQGAALTALEPLTKLPRVGDTVRYYSPTDGGTSPGSVMPVDITVTRVEGSRVVGIEEGIPGETTVELSPGSGAFYAIVPAALPALRAVYDRTWATRRALRRGLGDQTDHEGAAIVEAAMIQALRRSGVSDGCDAVVLNPKA